MKKYLNELDEMLIKDSVEELEKFAKKYFLLSQYQEFMKTTETVKTATLYKMICSRPAFNGTPLRKKASEWLAKHNMSEKINLKS